MDGKFLVYILSIINLIIVSGGKTLRSLISAYRFLIRAFIHCLPVFHCVYHFLHDRILFLFCKSSWPKYWVVRRHRVMLCRGRVAVSGCLQELLWVDYKVGL